MKDNLPLPQDKKLTVIFRLEPGCLGPQGSSHIDDFCQLAQTEFKSFNSGFVHWVFVPRDDKSLPEMQYQISEKNLTSEQAAKFLDIFNQNFVEFEDLVHKKIAIFIDHYLGH
ncbi:MAG: hypothetical protein OQL19_01400 [Gammaproteobacteria bacterium]|nr:hypothetical protein [Gammaproteobacteria bacterium]